MMSNRVASAFDPMQEAKAARLPSPRLTGAVGLADSGFLAPAEMKPGAR
ncbi:hypothetical protein [Cystobacter fuscus]